MYGAWLFFGTVRYSKEDITQKTKWREKDIRTVGRDLEIIFSKEILGQATRLKEISLLEDAALKEIKIEDTT